MPPKKSDAIDIFVENLQKYFNEEAVKIKKDAEGYTPEMRAMFLEFSDHLKACKTEIERIESEAVTEYEKEKGNLPPEIKNSPEAILKYLADKKLAKFSESEVARTIFTIACASNTEMKDCLAFAETFSVKDLTSFDLNTNLSPLAAAMLRKKGASKAMDALIRSGADIHAVSLDGNNIAHLAVLFGVNKQVLDYLIKQKVNFNQVNKNGFTPLDLAVGRRDLDFIKYLQDEAKAEFKFTPKKMQDALGDEEKLGALAKLRVPPIKEKSTIDRVELGRGIEKAFADIKVLDTAIPDAAKSLMRFTDAGGRNLALESRDIAVAANSLQQQIETASASSDQAQKLPNADGAKAAADLARKLAEQERHLKEQEQLLKMLQKADILPEVQSSLLDDIAATMRNLSYVVSVAAQVVEHAAKGEFDQMKELVREELGLDEDVMEIPQDFVFVDVQPKQAQQKPQQSQPSQQPQLQSQTQQVSLLTKLVQQPQQPEKWREHLEKKKPVDQSESFVAKVTKAAASNSSAAISNGRA